MSTSIVETMETIEHLPEGATLVLQDVTWDEYEKLLKDLETHPRLRVMYDQGRLEIMSPLNIHEAYGRLVDDLARIYADHYELVLEKFGSTTWKRKKLLQGLEPDGCYYVTNASRIIGRGLLDLDVDPPPDIALEIDITNESRSKFPIYAALGVLELWRYDSRVMEFYTLSGNIYQRTSTSQVLPGLKPELLAEAIEESKTIGQTAALAAFRNRLQSASSV